MTPRLIPGNRDNDRLITNTSIDRSHTQPSITVLVSHHTNGIELFCIRRGKGSQHIPLIAYKAPGQLSLSIYWKTPDVSGHPIKDWHQNIPCHRFPSSRTTAEHVFGTGGRSGGVEHHLTNVLIITGHTRPAMTRFMSDHAGAGSMCIQLALFVL